VNRDKPNLLLLLFLATLLLLLLRSVQAASASLLIYTPQPRTQNPSGTAPPLQASPTPGGPTVWLDPSVNDGRVELFAGQTLVVALESNFSTGYGWEIISLDRNALRPLGDPVYTSPLGQPGASGRQLFRFEPLAQAETVLTLAYRRPWEQGSAPANTFTLAVINKGTFPNHVAALSLLDDPIPGLDLFTAVSANQDHQGFPLPQINPSTDHLEGLPSSFNWCSRGACPPVRDQGPCGSCWAFSTVGVLEANIRIREGVWQDLSEQYLVSCNTQNWSCLAGGGNAHDYHLWKIPPGEFEAGAVSEADFPYQAADLPCNPPNIHRQKIASWAYVSENRLANVEAIKQAIYSYGPVAAYICVGPAFMAYQGGIFATDERSVCLGRYNHAVILTGWDTDQGVWYLRNSWGSGWGEKGAMRIRYGTSNVGDWANYIVYGIPAAPSLTPIVTTTPTPTTVPELPDLIFYLPLVKK
jgi:inhibitor of cysteine peptidase